jgi:hypothetical protein
VGEPGQAYDILPKPLVLRQRFWHTPCDENIDAFDSQTLDVVAQPFPTPGAQDNRQSPETPIGIVKMTSSPLLNRDG